MEGGEKEKIPDLDFHNILVTPGHSGWLTEESFLRQTHKWKECIESIINKNPINVLSEYYVDEGH